MLKLLCISCVVLGITVGLPTKDIDELIYRLEELKQQNHYDEPYGRFNLGRPLALGSFGGGASAGASDVDNNVIDDDEIIYRNLDGYGRTLANAYRSLNLGNDDFNRKRFYLEHKFNGQNTGAQHQLQQLQLQSKEQQQPSQQQHQAQTFLNNQHQLKRAIDSIGGANLLKRAVDRIGGGHLLKRRR